MPTDSALSAPSNSGSLELEVVPTTALESMQRAEIDTQIATAHRYPRSMANFKRRAVEMATLDEDTAASCLYSRPVGGGKFAEGMSVRMAEIVGAAYGNLRVGAIVVEQTERYVKARGFAHDLETNFASSTEVIESTVKKDGRPYDERMRIVIAKACIAKARRDATFQVVPKALCKPVEKEARAVALGNASTLGARREAVMQWIARLGIDVARVFAALGVKGEEDIGLEELATLTGLKTAIKDGDVTVDEAFPAAAVMPTKPLFNAPKPPPPAPVVPPVETATAPTEPVPQPTAPVAPAAADETVSDADLPAALASLLKSNEVDEAELMRWAVGKGLAKKDQTAVAQLATRKLRQIVDGWSQVQTDIFNARDAQEEGGQA